ncbi:hypothetical protein GALMADRAFT_260438 [Galerina marginata CBS 339.88]|uniref:UvrD-like helicase ATP-binding domain-containing protein n=1 Tax=Galerina marginata (strain CBS 339.88) TaxID=685588 RepID=A0A067TQY5_GALM3|nr:hypothetical protein GALMADRAFT_260438 [Galerina marginata CBS 339.88]
MQSSTDSVVGSAIELLHDENLKSEEELNEALLKLGQRLDESNFDIFLKLLLSPSPNITRGALELVLASSEVGGSIGKWLHANFPSNPETFYASLHASIIDKLSISLHFTYPFERETTMQLNTYRAEVDAAPQVLQALVQTRGRSSLPEPDVQDGDGIVVKVKQTQRQRKAARTAPKTAFDLKTTKALQVFEIDVADPDLDANFELSFVLDAQAEVLKFYINLLQDPIIESSIRRSYNPRALATDDVADITADDLKPVQNSIDSIPCAPAAFPMVQPMKAALYFDSAVGFGEWRILISTRADRDLREARRKDAKFFKIIIKKIKELSNGHFSDDNQKRLNRPNTEIPIYEAKMTRDSRLVYQIDCVPEYSADVERQVIKIFGVYTHAQIDKRLWDSVGYQLARKGKEYRRRCLFRNRPDLAGDNVFTPACFPPAEKVEEDDYQAPELPRESLEEIHSVLVLEKFMTFSQALLNSIIADLDVAYVFDVRLVVCIDPSLREMSYRSFNLLSSQEKEIVEYPHSCYVLGRSGTGKTTTMMFKMLGIERAYSMRKDSMQKPRQIFVTQSRVLAGKVEEYFSKLLESLATAERTQEELAQIFKSRRQQEENDGLIDIDDDHNWRGDLPKKFSQLQDQHFPLFLTFDRLASLLEADLCETSPSSGSLGSVGPSVVNGTAHEGSKLISYTAFLESYWPHFSQNLTKGLDPSLVFSEVMGVIQGSEESLSHETRFLDKKSYESLSHRAQYAFASRREVIYSIFQLYLKHKKARNEYDSSDRTHKILNAFKTIGVPGQKIDYLYVDEAQDNLLIDALLLRSLVRNPDGLFWAGDTAQTISVGSSFRFNDLKAFLFRLEKRREDSLLASSSIQEPPRTFQLAINFRSHGGIVQCAHSVIELITGFWPYAIDVLSRERGVVDGSKPVFFSGWDSDTVRYEQFLFGESGSPIEFGAQQCILVRDEAAREELRQQVGDIGLIMTLYESKGLEFDDVLLYKFFEDSTVDLSQWRVVLNLLRDQSRGQGVPAPRFDEIRHAGVCSELKFLYVAVTRARKNLWLVDCSEKCEPMREFWTSRNEVQNCTPGTDVPRLAVSSSPQEWEKSGRTLFQNKRYFQAMHCFERAGLNREVVVSHTYYLREQARSMPINGSKQAASSRQAAFLLAAEAFLECSLVAPSAKEKKAYLRSGGECYEYAQEDYKAAEAYAKAEEYNTAVKLYRKCAKFDEAVAIVTQKDGVETAVAENIIDIARLFYFKGGELEKASQLFSSVEEQLGYLEDFDLDVSRAALLEQLGKYHEAADIHLAEGRTLEAIRLLLSDDCDQNSVRRGNECILHGLWDKISFTMKDLGQIEDVVRLLDLASRVKPSGTLDSVVTDELLMFQYIKSGDSKNLRILGKKFASQNHVTAAIMCFDHFFTTWPNMHRMSSFEICEFLCDFLEYCNLMQKIANITSPCRNPHIRKLFGIVPSTENIFFLPSTTFLHGKVIESRAPLTGSNEQGVFITEWDLSRRFREYLLRRLTNRVIVENNACKLAQAFNPCPPHILNSYCNRKDCPRQHLIPSTLTREWYNLQVRIHLQQILVIQSFCPPFVTPVEKIKCIRQWAGRLFETLYPISFRLGGVANIDFSRIPEARRAFGVLKQWCLDVLYWPEHRRSDHKLLSTLFHVTKLLFHLDKPNAHRHLAQSRLLRHTLNQAVYYRTGPTGASIFVLPELVNTLSTVSDAGVLRGAVFLKHLLDNMLSIDATTLCETIEYLCGSIILVRNKMVLHNITLPRSWLQILLPKVNFDAKAPGLDVNPARDILVMALRQLIDSLHTGKGPISHLLVLAESSDLNNLALYRSIYISRLCRALCLLGYNVNNISLRFEIVKAMKSLRTGQKPHNLYKDYAHGGHWKALARLVQRSTDGSSLDEMIQLYHESKLSGAYPPPAGTRRVVYKNVADIPRLIDNSPPVVISNLRPDAPEFVPKPRLQETPAVDEAEAEVEVDAEPDIEEPDVDNTEIINTAPAAESIAIAELPEDNSPPSDEQVQAATRLQTAYRKVLKLRRKIPKTALDASRNTCFLACLEESRKIDWPDGSFYRLLFLGPLPHVLVCLNAAYAWAIDTKARNKKRFKIAMHQDLEDVNKRLTEQKKMIDGIKNLQKALNPPSELHRRRDIEELKKRVVEVEALLSQIAPNVARDVQGDMAMGLKGIVVKRLPKLKVKPSLRIDDDDGEDEAEVFGEVEQVVEAEAEEVVEDRFVVVHGYLEKANPGDDAEVQEVPVEVEEPAYTIIQSLPWVPVLPVGTQPSAAEESDESSESSVADGLVMHSLSWVPI